jgi:flagellar biosynthesis protein FlhF
MHAGRIQPFGHRSSNKKEKTRHFHANEMILPGNTAERTRSKSQIPQALPGVNSRLYQQLGSQGVEKSIASELVGELNSLLSSARSQTTDTLKKALIHILENRGITTQRVRIEAGQQKIAAFIGPPGVGKTSTIAKLAAAAKIRNRNGSIALITVDNDRIAAIQQLKTYAKIIGIPIQAASNQKELKKAIKRFQNKRLILVDTPGLSQNDTRQINDLKGAFQRIRDLEVHLLLSAPTKEADLMDMIQRFNPICFTRLIFTKLDESTSYGNLLTILVRTKIPLSYFTNGRDIPDGIEIATLEKLADLILKPEKEKKVWPFSPGILKPKTGKSDAYTHYFRKHYRAGEK